MIGGTIRWPWENEIASVYVIGPTANNAIQDGWPNLRGHVHEGLRYASIIFLSRGDA